MSTRTRTLPTLVLPPPLLGATLLGPASAARAQQSIALHANLHGSILQVRGSRFTPGARVDLALTDTRSWGALIRGSAKVGTIKGA